MNRIISDSEECKKAFDTWFAKYDLKRGATWDDYYNAFKAAWNHKTLQPPSGQVDYPEIVARWDAEEHLALSARQKDKLVNALRTQPQAPVVDSTEDRKHLLSLLYRLGELWPQEWKTDLAEAADHAKVYLEEQGVEVDCATLPKPQTEVEFDEAVSTIRRALQSALYSTQDGDKVRSDALCRLMVLKAPVVEKPDPVLMTSWAHGYEYTEMDKEAEVFADNFSTVPNAAARGFYVGWKLALLQSKGGR